MGSELTHPLLSHSFITDWKEQRNGAERSAKTSKPGISSKDLQLTEETMEEKHGPTPGSFEEGGCIERKRGHEVALGARRRVFLNQFSGEVSI